MLSKEYTIAVDLDDVLIDTCECWVNELNLRFNTSVSVQEITDWCMCKFFPELTEEQVYSPLYDVSFWDKVPVKHDAVEFLNRLIDDGYNVIIVTASNPDTAEEKFYRTLYKYFPSISKDDVILTSDKSSVRCDVIVDDYLRNLVAVDNCDRLLFDAPHNRKFNADMFACHRVHNWEEIYNYICTNFI